MKISRIQRMYILSFLFILHIAISAYVNALYLTQFISEKYVGLLYTAASVITLVLLSQTTTFLKNFGNRRLSIILLVINMIGLAVLVGSKNSGFIALAFICVLSTNTLVALCLDIFIQHFGNPATIGKTRGLYLTIINLAWMLSPLITAILITQEGGYRTIYALSFFVTLVMTIGLFFSVKNFGDKTYIKTPFLQSYRYLKNNRHMLSIMVINFILQFFYTIMVIYTPIYLIRHIGFGWDQIGVIFTVMLTPFIIFGLPVGILIDKYHISKRTLLRYGFSIMSISTLAIAFIKMPSIALWALVLFLTRTGASIVETTAEIYFFTHATEEDAHLLGIYRDMGPMGYIVSPLFATVLFLFVPFNYIFLVLSIVLLSAFYYINHLKHNHEPAIPYQNQ